MIIVIFKVLDLTLFSFNMQVIELENMKSQDTVVLGIDGQIEKSDDPVDWYNDDEPIELLCQICKNL